MRRPDHNELIAALGTLLAEYSEIDEMLDNYMGAHGATCQEKARQRTNNRAMKRVLKVYERAVR